MPELVDRLFVSVRERVAILHRARVRRTLDQIEAYGFRRDVVPETPPKLRLVKLPADDHSVDAHLRR